MCAVKLIRNFSSKTKLPVALSDVVDEMRLTHGVKDEIYHFWDIDLDPRILRGYIVREEIPSPSGNYFISTISCAKLGEEFERLVICKELLHILDPAPLRVATEDQLQDLVENIVLPPELVDTTTGKQAASDRIAILEALAVLFPMASRDVLLPYYRKGSLSLAKIADLAELPELFISFALSDKWPDIIERILEFKERNG